jgi:ATP-dependent RNA helicase DeaD
VESGIEGYWPISRSGHILIKEKDAPMTEKMMTFQESDIDKNILKALSEMGFAAPMPIQQEVIPFVLHQTRDLVALAHTGTGKTAAFGIPILSRSNSASGRTQALILAPTRELCLQITDDLTQMSKYIRNLNIVPFTGAPTIVTQIRQVAPARRLSWPPGRMLDMLTRRKVDVSAISCWSLTRPMKMLKHGISGRTERRFGLDPRGQARPAVFRHHAARH